MGMYTELIFGAKLEENTPNEVIEILKFMIGKTQQKPANFPWLNGRHEYLFTGGSYYFGVNKSISKMWNDDIDNSWHISTRANIKNYDREIEQFLEWVKPYIDSGSGSREMYAIVIYEDGEPEMYFLYNE